MAYKKAIEVLPEALLTLIQDYVDGEYLYIPRKEEHKKAWGEKGDAKQLTKLRNDEIYKRYQAGESMKALAEAYCLSIKSIQGIILKIKREIA